MALNTSHGTVVTVVESDAKDIETVKVTAQDMKNIRLELQEARFSTSSKKKKSQTLEKLLSMA